MRGRSNRILRNFRQTFVIGSSQFEQILANPFVGKKLKGSKDRYSVRMGRDFRVGYTVFKNERVVAIEFVGDRKDAYRWL
jgi:mRNA-degrading endonuclease RelE of RelBE toxin-antitoxin system